MKTSIRLLTVVAAFSLASITSYAKDAMDMKSSTSVEKNISGKGTVVSTNNDLGKVTLSHEAIPSIGWGPMTMDFKVKDKMLLNKIKKSDKVQFTLVKQGTEYMINQIK